MLTRWHLLNLPVENSDHRNLGFHVAEILMDWPRPVFVGLVLRRRFQSFVLLIGPGMRITPFGIRVDAMTQVRRAGRGWLRTYLNNTQSWLHAPMVGADDIHLGFVHDLVIDEDQLRIAGLLISRGLLHDLWTGSEVLPIENVEVLAGRRIKRLTTGQTVGENGTPKGGGAWTV